MKLLVQITDSINGYLNNVAAVYKRVEIKGNIPEPLKKKFVEQLVALASTTDEIRTHVEKIPETQEKPL